MNNRIQHRRMPIEWLVARRVGSDEEFGLVLNLTLCGMHVRTKARCRVGGTFDLVIDLPEDYEGLDGVTVHAEVRWCRSAGDGFHDVGMQITEGISQKDLETVATVFFRYSA